MIIILGCGGCGFTIAASHKKETNSLQQLMTAFNFMQYELQYKMSPLPELCKLTAITTKGHVRIFFLTLAQELEQQISPDVKTCVDAALSKCKSMPQQTRNILVEFGNTLGSFALEGQLQSLKSIRELTENHIRKHTENQANRIRSYQTLGLCAGAALAILFI